jgi:dTDP-4-amino-4,6-dideoxygalactose transaminase
MIQPNTTPLNNRFSSLDDFLRVLLNRKVNLLGARIKINLFEPNFTNFETEAVVKTMQSGWTGRGKLVEKFEFAVSEKLRTTPQNITTTTCATEAIFAIFELLGIKKGDEVILPSTSFLGMGNVILECGATPVFCDINPNNFQIEKESLLDCISKKTKVVIINHYGGFSSIEASFIKEIRSRGIRVIEDAACSFGAYFPDSPKDKVGTVGDFGIWSFDSMKLLSMGDGGAIYAADIDELDWISRRNYFGLSGEGKSGFANASDNSREWWEFQIELPGRRAILNDIAASIGLVQLKRFEEIVSVRERVIEYYLENLRPIEQINLPYEKMLASSSVPYLFWIQTERRTELANFLLKNEIYTSFRYLPLHRQKLFQMHSVIDRVKLNGTNFAADRTLNLPLHGNLKQDQLNFICTKISEFFHI